MEAPKKHETDIYEDVIMDIAWISMGIHGYMWISRARRTCPQCSWGANALLSWMPWENLRPTVVPSCFLTPIVYTRCCSKSVIESPLPNQN